MCICSNDELCGRTHNSTAVACISMCIYCMCSLALAVPVDIVYNCRCWLQIHRRIWLFIVRIWHLGIFTSNIYNKSRQEKPSNIRKMRRLTSSCAFLSYLFSIDTFFSSRGKPSPWWDCTDAQADLCRRCPDMPKVTFLHSAAFMIMACVILSRLIISAHRIAIRNKSN